MSLGQGQELGIFQVRNERIQAVDHGLTGIERVRGVSERPQECTGRAREFGARSRERIGGSSCRSLGEGEDQTPLGAVALHERCGREPHLFRDVGQGEPRGTEPEQRATHHLDERRIRDAFRSSHGRLINECSFINQVCSGKMRLLGAQGVRIALETGGFPGAGKKLGGPR